MKKMQLRTISVLAIAFFLTLLSATASFAADKPENGAESPEGVQPLQAVLMHEINITLDLKDRELKGTDIVTVREGAQKLRLLLRGMSVVESVENGGAALTFTANELDNRRQEVLIDLPKSPTPVELKLKVSFKGKFQPVDSARENVQRGVAYLDDGVIGEEGALLLSSANWYPHEEGALTPFELTVSLPVGYSAVSEGARVPAGRDVKTDGKTVMNRWKSDKPLAGIDIVAARFHVEKEKHKGIDIYTFFLNKDDALSKLYIKKTREYLDMYAAMFGAYPFMKFAVVESFLPTGYGMPSFTLLGSTVIRLPFIPDTSLGHEIAHNWWGNSVFPESAGGNWTEALTTFTADYALARKKGLEEARDFRTTKLWGYKNFAGPDETSLADFSDATTKAARAVGYNKGTMVLNMLYNYIGEDAFNAGLKEFYSRMAFKKAAWKDIMNAFEKTSGKDLYWFFDQWLSRTGGPELAVENVQVTGGKAPYVVSFNIKQKAPAYIMTLPIGFKTEKDGLVKKTMAVSGEDYKAYTELSSKPVSVEVDPDYENFRLLSSAEIPPSFGAVFGDRKAVVVVPSAGEAREKYLAGAELLAKDFDLTLVTDDDEDMQEHVKNGSVFVLGGPSENRAFAVIQSYLKGYLNAIGDPFVINGKSYPAASFTVGLAVKSADNPIGGIGVFAAVGGPDETLEKIKRMRFFLDESYVIIANDRKVEKGRAPAENRLKKEILP
ncbi:MAG: hypothetical protein HZB82_07265 [Deltaproteobacteria bacterium]|nr:hypothetical protein [Deltaproteobacteria bacterium]